MRILLAIDGSKASDAAVTEVARRPWPAGSSVRVLSVAPSLLPAEPLAWYAPGVELDAMEQQGRTHAASIVDGAAARLRSAGLEAETKVLLGHARAIIVEEAEAWPADLIVIGSHGHTAMHRLLLGSVAQYVVAHAPCSVEVVRTGAARARRTSP
jgi:nucleotide-binding universal stress UspA family protein